MSKEQNDSLDSRVYKKRKKHPSSCSSLWSSDKANIQRNHPYWLEPLNLNYSSHSRRFKDQKQCSSSPDRPPQSPTLTDWKTPVIANSLSLIPVQRHEPLHLLAQISQTRNELYPPIATTTAFVYSGRNPNDGSAGATLKDSQGSNTREGDYKRVPVSMERAKYDPLRC